MLQAGTRKRWRYRTTPPVPADSRTGDWGRVLGVPSLLGLLLAQRAQTTPAAADAFLNSKLTQLHEPQDIPGLNQAAQRLARAVREKQPIVIYGDYDVDGISASAILWHMLRAAGGRVETYVPHRIDEGYGLNSDAITQLVSASSEPPLLISVDCGITACAPAATAKELGVDLIITDHHQFDPDHLPDAHTLVHPRLPGSTYPCGDLCGAGVAFKLAWHFARTHFGSARLPEAVRDLLMDLVSLAALGTVADVVPLLDENRVIASFGLARIRHTRLEGLNALIRAAKLEGEKIDAYHVGFVLGPRLNACGRMGHARHAVRMLTDAPTDEAEEIAHFLTAENEKRRQTERDIFAQAAQQVVERGYDQPDCRAIVVAHADWHPGVVGIVASRLVEAFHRPALVLNLHDGEAHGSARSVDGVSIHAALQACAPFMTSFGGHEMAAGLRLPAERLDDFRTALVAQVNALLDPADLRPTLDVDADCELAELGLEVVKQVERLAPFGRSNPRPVLCARNVTVEGQPQRMGQGGKHLRLRLRQGATVCSVLAWNRGEEASELLSGMALDVAFEVKIDTWQNRQRVDLVLCDWRPAGSVEE